MSSNSTTTSWEGRYVSHFNGQLDSIKQHYNELGEQVCQPFQRSAPCHKTAVQWAGRADESTSPWSLTQQWAQIISWYDAPDLLCLLSSKPMQVLITHGSMKKRPIDFRSMNMSEILSRAQCELGFLWIPWTAFAWKIINRWVSHNWGIFTFWHDV